MITLRNYFFNKNKFSAILNIFPIFNSKTRGQPYEAYLNPRIVMYELKK